MHFFCKHIRFLKFSLYTEQRGLGVKAFSKKWFKPELSIRALPRSFKGPSGTMDFRHILRFFLEPTFLRLEGYSFFRKQFWRNICNENWETIGNLKIRSNVWNLWYFKPYEFFSLCNIYESPVYILFIENW